MRGFQYFTLDQLAAEQAMHRKSGRLSNQNPRARSSGFIFVRLSVSSRQPSEHLRRRITGTLLASQCCDMTAPRAGLVAIGTDMKRHARGILTALAAPAVAGALFIASPATAAVATTAPAAALLCHASMSNSRPADYTTIYVNVGTARYAAVTTVAHYKTVNREHVGRANGEGNTAIRYRISGATPSYRVTVSVTVTSGRSRGTCSTSFMPHR
jgi:hypothetical protein